MEDLTLGRTMLYDFYGGLLTEKQNEYFDLHYNEDLSLAEIAEQAGVSRQSVWDIIRRAEAVLRDAEEKTGLLARYTEQKKLILDMKQKLAKLAVLTDGRANALAAELSEDMDRL